MVEKGNSGGDVGAGGDWTLPKLYKQIVFCSFMEAKEEKIRRVTSMYYSRPDVQKAIYDFSKKREISPRYFEGFGKRPDSFQYPGDIFELVKKGATSFHCSEEIWQDPLKLSTSMTPEQASDLREGWDLLIDIDCKWFDYSKKTAEALINVFKKHRIKNFGIKYSGSKGFHMIIPWKAFPKNLAGEDTKNLFPELPRKIISYIRFQAEEEMKEILPEDFYAQFKDSDIRRGIKCSNCKEIANEYYSIKYFCPKCKREEVKKTTQRKDFHCPECMVVFEIKDEKKIYECKKCEISSEKNPRNFSRGIELDIFDLIGLDLVLVSPRHLFRMPYSLHEKTALASAVITEDELKNFQPKDADPMTIKTRNFLPDSGEGEATELVIQALDWFKENFREPKESKQTDFKPIKIDKFSDSFLPPSIQKILQGIGDGRKRALFILVNLFNSIGMEKDETEKRILEWNKKNKIPLKSGYIKTQLAWSYRNKTVPPPNFDKDYYRAIGIIPTDEELKLKNPISYVLKKANIRQKQG